MHLRRYLIPAGTWSTLGAAVVLLLLYLLEGGPAKGAAAVAFVALSVALRAYGIARELQGCAGG